MIAGASVPAVARLSLKSKVVFDDVLRVEAEESIIHLIWNEELSATYFELIQVKGTV